VEQTSKTTGECFLQGRIDDPSMARLSISAFRQSDGSYNVVWLPRRRSGFRVAASADDNPTYLDAA
jgi:uncharacterized protein (DUF736 family)